MALGKNKKDPFAEKKPTDKETSAAAVSRPKPGISDYIAGEAKSFVGNLSPYLPQELIGGSVPHIPGTEEEAVCNAASQACSTEKVCFTYTVESNKVFYLACPSHTLASHPDSWCPLAAALPGNSEYWDKETVYLYEQEGLASALRWDPETNRIQVFLGASRTILPRIQSMDANFVTINPDVADIVPWKNRSLKTEKLSRATVRGLLFSGLVIAFLASAMLFFTYLSVNMLERNLDRVKSDTDRAAEELMMKSAKIMQSDTIKNMVRIQNILDQLSRVDGTLVRYEVKRGKVEWEALIPQAFTGEFKRVEVLDFAKDGRIRIKGR